MRWPWHKSESEVDHSYLGEVITNRVALGRPFLETNPDRYLALTAAIIEEKLWEAAAGFTLQPDMIVTIAANAAVPIMGLDMWAYRTVRSIIVHPTTTVTKGTRRGPSDSVASDTEMHIIGQASPYSGPLSLSWDAVAASSNAPHHGQNVVIHEFAHKIDMTDGEADGVPPLRRASLQAWEDLLDREYRHSNSCESDWDLRAYAWTNKAEFFAVATESFFTTPDHLRQAKPDLFRGLCDFYCAQSPN